VLYNGRKLSGSTTLGHLIWFCHSENIIKTRIALCAIVSNHLTENVALKGTWQRFILLLCLENLQDTYREEKDDGTLYNVFNFLIPSNYNFSILYFPSFCLKIFSTSVKI
jgi:hypothetical protein